MSDEENISADFFKTDRDRRTPRIEELPLPPIMCTLTEQTADEAAARGSTGLGARNIANQQQQGQKGKFVLETDIPDDQMLDIGVTLKKQNYGKEGTKEWKYNMELATRPLSQEFGVGKHRITTRLSEAGDGDQTQYLHVQQTISSLVYRMDEGHKRAEAMDWMDICTLPRLAGDTSSHDPSEWWDESQINIWKDWDSLEEGQVHAWQYSINKRFSEGDRVASRWLKSFVANSSSGALRALIDKKYDKLPPNQQGGVIYLYYATEAMFTMSRDVKAACLGYFAYIRKKGLAAIPNENVAVLEIEYLGVARRLNAAGSLQDEVVEDLLEGLCICSNAKFRNLFDALLQNIKLGNFSLLSGITTLSTTLEIIEAILSKANAEYDKLCISGVWNKANEGGGAGMHDTAYNALDAGIKCFNCGGDHLVKDCDKPKSRARIKQAYEEWKKNKANDMQDATKCDSSSHDVDSESEGDEVKKASEGDDSTKPEIKNNPAPVADTARAASSSAIITLSRSTLESKINTFVMTSTDPSAPSIAAAIRELLLN